MTQTPTDALRLATRFHETYERLAPSFGYETRQDTKKFDHETPNGRLMVAVCAELAAAPASPLPGGGPTCQLCSSKIEGWICQGCGSHFCENDAGALVLNNISAAPTGDA